MQFENGLSPVHFSCKPKARIAYLGNEAIMVPTSPLPEGEVLTIDEAQHSYINDLLPREERRRLLRVRYRVRIPQHVSVLD